MQMVKKCEELEEENNIEGLNHFFFNLPRPLPPELAHNESILRARAYYCFQRGEYQELYRIIESTPFRGNHQRLQTMWQEAHYREAEKQRNR